MRGSWLVVLAACSSGTEPRAATGSGANAALTPTSVTGPAPVGPITSRHGASIAIIAVTDAGDAAVTADTGGALRLWPTLDGTREPVVVTGPPPHALDVASDGDGLVIANQDAAGGLELVRLDARGQVRSRARIANEPVALEVELTSAGALVLRADQAVELHDTSGVLRARLVPDPGTRIVALVARAGRVLAIISDDRQARARSIDVSSGTATWGELSPKLALDPMLPIALSPDHRLLLGVQPGKRGIPALVDRKTGQDTKVLVCMTSAERERRQRLTGTDGGFLGLEGMVPAPLGFVDASKVACLSGGNIGWWTTDGTQLPIVGVPVLVPGILGGLIVSELHVDDLHGSIVRARRSYVVPGQLRTVDRSGRVYAQGAGATDVVVYVRGTQYARLSGLGGMSLRPSPDATELAAFRDGKIRLVTVDGRMLWEVAVWESADLDWTTSSELIVRFRAAVAKLDRATGALRERQCGWAFGRSDKPFDHGPDLPLVCDVSP